MRVTILGTSGGIPIPGRAQSGILVESEETNILLDCGMSVPLRMAEVGQDPIMPDNIFLTHGHLDHIQDLPSLTKASWLKDEDILATTFSPRGLTEKIPSFFKAVSEWERANISLKPISPGEEVSLDDISVKSFPTPHTDESQGYIIFAEGSKVVYTGDTTPNERIKEIGDGSNLLIHELSLMQKSDIHTSPPELIELVKGMDIQRLLLTHFYPKIEKKISKIADDIQTETGIDTIPAEDKTSFKL